MSEPIEPPETRTTKAEQLAEHYTAVWMEPDANRRRRMIAELWSEDAIHILQPTQEVYEAADERAVNPTWQVRGHHELEARVTSANEDFVATRPDVFSRPARREAPLAMWSLGAGKASHWMARCSAPASSSSSSPPTAESRPTTSSSSERDDDG